MMKKIFFSLFLIIFSLQKILNQIYTKNNLNDYNVNNKNNKHYTVSDINIIGSNKYTKNEIINFIKINIGDKIEISEIKIQYIINKLWNTYYFKNIHVYIKKEKNENCKLFIYLEDLYNYNISLIRINGIENNEIKHIIKNNNMRQYINKNFNEKIYINIKKNIKKYFYDLGYPDTIIKYNLTKNILNNKDVLNLYIVKGPRIKIKQIIFKGNKELSENKLYRLMNNTFKKKFITDIFNFSKYTHNNNNKDINNIKRKYQSLGFRDIKIYTKLYRYDPENYILKVIINEGQKYKIGNINFIGNNIINNKLLNNILPYKHGDVYNFIKIRNTILNKKYDKSIISYYINNGYLLSNIKIIEIPKNNIINLKIYISEGDKFFLNNIFISGNSKTKDHIVIKELLTKPGNTFSNIDIRNTFLNLSNLGFFDPKKIKVEVDPKINTNKVNIKWGIEEKSDNKINLHGGYNSGQISGNFGINLPNFSINNLFNIKKWNPIPEGNGQKLFLSSQIGSIYKSYKISFIDNYLNKKLISSLFLNLNYSNYLLNNYNDFNKKKIVNIEYYKNILEKLSDNRIKNNGFMNAIGASIGFNKELSWIDKYLIMSLTINYELYNRKNYNLGIKKLSKTGLSNDLNIIFSLKHISLEPNLIFPKNGSDIKLNTTFTLPYSYIIYKKKYNENNKYKWIEYYKIKSNVFLYKNIYKNIILKIGGEFGFIGDYNENKNFIPFQGFYLGGTNASDNVGNNIENFIPLRGYSNNENFIHPQNGGFMYNKILAELRYPIINNNFIKIWGLNFFEGGNIISNEQNNYNPFFLKKSFGSGIRFYTSISGLLGVDVAYAFNKQINTSSSKWKIHFIIGDNI